MVENKRTQSSRNFLGGAPHFKNPLEITLFMYLIFRRDYPASIAAAFFKAEKDGLWSCSEWGYNGLKIQQNISTALLNMQDRDILTSIQDDCVKAKKTSTKQRKTPFKKCHYYSVNPDWITNTMYEEYRAEANKKVVHALGLLQSCAPSRNEVINYINQNIGSAPSLMEQSSTAFQVAIDSLNRILLHIESDRFEDPFAAYGGYLNGWPPLQSKTIQSAINETGLTNDELYPIISDVTELLKIFRR